MRFIVLVALGLVALLVGACSAPYHRCDDWSDAWRGTYWGLNYPVAPTLWTAKDIAVDSDGQPVDLARVDRLTDETEACLVAAFPDGVVPPEVQHSAWCNARVRTNVERSCITVLTPNDWWIGKSGDQLLPHGNGGGCTDKGFVGPCYWRVGLQSDRVIVVPPEMKLYKEGVVRLTTGCANPWGSKVLAACMTVTPE